MVGKCRHGEEVQSLGPITAGPILSFDDYCVVDRLYTPGHEWESVAPGDALATSESDVLVSANKR